MVVCIKQHNAKGLFFFLEEKPLTCGIGDLCDSDDRKGVLRNVERCVCYNHFYCQSCMVVKVESETK